MFGSPFGVQAAVRHTKLMWCTAVMLTMLSLCLAASALLSFNTFRGLEEVRLMAQLLVLDKEEGKRGRVMDFTLIMGGQWYWCIALILFCAVSMVT